MKTIVMLIVFFLLSTTSFAGENIILPVDDNTKIEGIREEYKGPVSFFATFSDKVVLYFQKGSGVYIYGDSTFRSQVVSIATCSIISGKPIWLFIDDSGKYVGIRI